MSSYRRIPALVISGADDPTFTGKMGDELAAQFDQSQHLYLPGAGHVLMAEFPELVNEAIAHWVSCWVK